MEGACSTHRRKEIFMHGFGVVNLKKRYQLVDLSVDGRVILKYVT